ncbi:Mcp2p [Sugiyamaella lignohabitans]|uniref:Mcp2p n=1 Tax=Sugiyamaella lignohabitans TaxID=796027 RepID=A0A167CAI1_9ASCO|nr:Mcp2p [Sugiyamaella lignohabitans]ANB11432.1 Mcp2p [Sugiyamaella lignohabitans]
MFHLPRSRCFQLLGAGARPTSLILAPTRGLTYSCYESQQYLKIKTIRNFGTSKTNNKTIKGSTTGSTIRPTGGITSGSLADTANIQAAINATVDPSKIAEVSSNTNRKRKYWPRSVFLVLAGTTLGVTLLYNTNDKFATGSRHLVLAGQRISTVTKACIQCFRAYRHTLNQHYATHEEYLEALSECHKKCALITRKAIEKNAGIFIKLGQHLAALTYIFPEEWTSAMIPLQDQCPESSLESIREMFLKDSKGKVSLDDLFSSFDTEPLGTASLAQVHKATLRENGQQVAVKVQHPSLQEFVPLDVLMTRVVFSMIDYFFPEYPLSWLGDELQASIFVELDFREEAKNAMNTKKYFKDFYNATALRIPTVISAHKRVLVMEFLQGGRLDDQEYLKEHNISPSEVSSCLSHIFNNMIFTPGVGLHCDPHPGNLSLIPHKGGKHNFEIILYDHGLYRDVPTNLRRSYAHFWLALLDGDEPKMRYYAKEFAGIDDDNFRLFSAAITGRDFENATKNVISKRSEDEIKHMTDAIAEGGLLSQIMVLLHSMPRIVLLILKTNDLTRYLDEKLASPLGPERTFLIMATYCARTVYHEGREIIDRQFNGNWSISRMVAEISNWWRYFSRQSQLAIYDLSMLIRNRSHL